MLWSHGGEPDSVCEVLKLGSTFTTVFLLVFLYLWHKRKFEHAQITNALLQRDTFMSSGILVEFVFEALFYAVHAPAFVNLEFETHYFDLQQACSPAQPSAALRTRRACPLHSASSAPSLPVPSAPLCALRAPTLRPLRVLRATGCPRS